MNRARKQRGGQALVMVTLALMAMFGLMGLAVDLGWAFYVEKKAQAAADTGALAAVKVVLDAAGAGGPAAFSCGGAATCAADPVPCPAGGNLASACLYAAQNGFTTGERQTVTVQASDASTPPTVSGCTPTVTHPPTAPCVDTAYWVTVRVSEKIPQLFSMILGNRFGTASARATAAVAKGEARGSLLLINRQSDPWEPFPGGQKLTGTNLAVFGTPTVEVPGGIHLASNSATSPTMAGWIQGGGWVESPYTYVRTGGWVDPEPNVPGSPWRTVVSNEPDGDAFYDPLRGKGQPPLYPNQANLPYIGVPRGGGGRYLLDETATLPDGSLACPGGVCPPGNYYAYDTAKDGSRTAVGAPITITGTIEFRGATPGSGFGAFGDYVFFGGLAINQGASVTMGPGRYVFAGVNTAYTDTVLNMDNRAWVTGGAGEGSDAGRVLILTDSSYDHMLDAARDNFPITKSWTSLQFGKAGIKSGNNDDSRVQLYGLNAQDNDVKSTTANAIGYKLDEFAPAVIWQDQKNSNVKYTDDGYIDTTSCGAGYDLDNPCTNPESPSRQLDLWASQYAAYGGYIYQPRGAWTVVQAGPGYEGPLQIVSGAMKLQGSGDLTLTGPSRPILRYVAALVE